MPVALASAALCWRMAGPASAEIVILAGWLIIVQAGALLSLIDLAVMRLPSPLVAGLAAVVSVCITAAAYLAGEPWWVGSAILGGSAIGGLYLLFALALPRVVGLGDVRLAAVLGCALGVGGWGAVILGLALPYLLVFPFAVAQLKRGATRGSHLPFGPFLIAGAVLAAIMTGV